jgi:putative ABC transport system permease protein
MSRFRSFILRLVNVFRRSKLDSDLRDQLEAHREMIKADLLAHGVDSTEAEAAARRALGNDALVREFSRDEMLHRWLDVGIRDVRYALRGLTRTPVFTLTVIFTLGLGIGANTAIFSAVDRLLLRPLPYPNGEQIMMLHENGLKTRHMDVSPANWLDWQRESHDFESFAAWTDRFPQTMTGEGEPERLETQGVSYEFFPLLGVKPLVGRVFSAEDDRPRAAPKVIISYSLWRRRFSGDPGIVGRSLRLDGTPVEVIGVMPAGFYFLTHDTDIWGPFRLDRNLPWRNLGGRFIPYVVARLKPSFTASEGQSEMDGIAARLSQLYPFNKNTSASVIPLREVMSGEVRTSLVALFAAVDVLLLIACSNVANLLIARSAYRRREIAIRTSIGAGRGAIVRQLLVESVLLAAAGGIAGIFIARWGLGILTVLAPQNLLPLADIGIDRSMLFYTMALSLITGILVGLVPAIPSLRLDIADYLRSGGRSVTGSTRLRHTLIVFQVALTVVLLCGAGLLVRTLLALTRDPTGVRPKSVLSMRVELPESRYNSAQQVAFFRDVTERLRNLPGVESAAAGWDLPVSIRRIAGTSFRILGEPELPPADRPTTRVRVVTRDYFKTLGIPMLRGRDFMQDEQQSFIVNEAFAKKFFPSHDPMEASLSVFMQRPDNPFGRIIGVAGDVKEGTLRGAPEPTVFYNYRQLTFPGMTLLVRSERGAEITGEAARIVREIDRNLPLIEVQTLEDAFAESAARERLNAVVSGSLAVCALLLASLGLYGLLAFTVAERTKEIGIRMALGARASVVLWTVARQGLTLIAAGAGVGLIAAFAASRVLSSLLFGISVRDPLIFAAAPSVVVLVSLVAILIPSVRATHVNPIMTLRED